MKNAEHQRQRKDLKNNQQKKGQNAYKRDSYIEGRFLLSNNKC